MGFFSNADIVVVGAVVAAIGMLGFIVFESDRSSKTHQALFFFSLATIAWSVANYLAYHSDSPSTVLEMMRLVLFFAVFHALSFFHLCLVFPKKEISFPRWYTRGI